jgi:hypothetical protein
MGQQPPDQNALFYDFCLEDYVPQDHLLRPIDPLLDLSPLRGHLAPYYNHTGRPSVDPEVMIRMLVSVIATVSVRNGGLLKAAQRHYEIQHHYLPFYQTRLRSLFNESILLSRGAGAQDTSFPSRICA